MRDDFLIHEDQDRDYDDREGVGPCAGIFLLAGEYHVANRGSRAEGRLLDAGALRVANVRFDGAPDRGAVSGGSAGPRTVRLRDLVALRPRPDALRLAAPPGEN